MKFLDIIKTANANLLRNKGRTALTIVAIFIGSFTISLSLALNAGINDYINRQLGAIGGDGIIIVSPKIDLEGQDSGPRKYDPDQKTPSSLTSMSSMADMMMTEKDQDRIAAVEGVKKVQTIKSPAITYIQYDDGDKYEISAVQGLDGFQADLLAGKHLDNNISENQILLPLDYIEPLGLKNNEDAIGKTISVLAPNKVTGESKVFTATVVGVLNKTIISTGAGSDGASLNEHFAKELLDYENTGVPESMLRGAMMFIVNLEDGVNIEDVKQRIIDTGYDADTVADMIGQVKSVIDAITYVLVAFATIALLAASFGIVNTLYMSVSERTREIGLMKAMGLSGGKVFTIFSFEAILIGFWGSLVAILAAVGVGNIVNTIANDTFLKDLTGFNLMMYPIWNIGLVIVIIILIAFLAGALPARKASKLNPIDALRYE